MKHFPESIYFIDDIEIKIGKEYMIFYDSKNKVADIKEVIGYSGNQPIFKKSVKG